MVVILTGSAGSARTTLGRELAARLKWRFEDARDLTKLHGMAARATDRREPTVIASSHALDPGDCERLRELRNVRFVQVVTARPRGPSFADLAIEAQTSVDASVAAIRREFGV